MAAFGSVLIALAFGWVTYALERSQRVNERVSGMMLTLSGLALMTFATVNLVLVEEPVHVLPGALGALFAGRGVLRLRRTPKDAR